MLSNGPRGGETVSAAGGAPVRVVVLDHLRLSADALCALLEPGDQFDVVAKVAFPSEAVHACEDGKVDVAVVSMSLPGLEGIRVVERLRRGHPAVKVVVLAAPEQLGLAARAMAAGAHEYVSKLESGESLRRAIADVAGGRAGQAVTGERAASIAALDEDLQRLESLTPREIEVLQIMATGPSTTRLAHSLGVTALTARTHIKSILRKLGAHSRLEAVTIARRLGVIGSIDATAPVRLPS
jgi:DNA-binding NarL/FixJ family response regulator